MTPNSIAAAIRHNRISGAVALVLAKPITTHHDKLVVQINRLMRPTQQQEAA